ncbi:hypothetical protein PLESTF_000538400 [Pleodorina starrii]|nr:hypothetical protein PLESTF_000538400 [Pleodorina starrii]
MDDTLHQLICKVKQPYNLLSTAVRIKGASEAGHEATDDAECATKAPDSSSSLLCLLAHALGAVRAATEFNTSADTFLAAISGAEAALGHAAHAACLPAHQVRRTAAKALPVLAQIARALVACQHRRATSACARAGGTARCAARDTTRRRRHHAHLCCHRGGGAAAGPHGPAAVPGARAGGAGGEDGGGYKRRGGDGSGGAAAAAGGSGSSRSSNKSGSDGCGLAPGPASNRGVP